MIFKLPHHKLSTGANDGESLTSMIVGPPGAGALVLGGGFDLLNLFILADLCNTLGEYDKAVRACNQIGQ
ncbi:hypothetical protein GYMLUDRAFT_253452 [Collybiopsis luxurians FD-317 M1]|uniref:Uncharacterized protein n=1 Tax=Collybiopsis luxurians FD-317 M1 TaxID=944289 RepID=A0A0D0C573_9AGAR|nr:hypothetical protein GYMLUDRAFT_253452 [Collybiopsis luxurians FD-317 M1]